MTTELRDYGDGKAVVVYTNDRTLATQLSNYRDCFKIIPYEQEQRPHRQPAKLVLVGIDYYFPKKKLKALCRKLNIPSEGLKKFGSISI